MRASAVSSMRAPFRSMPNILVGRLRAADFDGYSKNGFCGTGAGPPGRCSNPGAVRSRRRAGSMSSASWWRSKLTGTPRMLKIAESVRISALDSVLPISDSLPSLTERYDFHSFRVLSAHRRGRFDCGKRQHAAGRRDATFGPGQEVLNAETARESFHSVSRLSLAAPCQIRSRRAKVRAGLSAYQCVSVWRMCSSSLEASCALTWRSPRDLVLSGDCGRKIGGRRKSPSRTIASSWLLGIGERDGGWT